MQIGLVTCAEWPNLTGEDQLLLTELRALGLDAQPVVWDDPSVDWSVPKVCVIRETWDYHRQRDKFLAWADQVSGQSTLLNSAEVVRWNTHKGYLRDLEARGVPVVPTAWLDAGNSSNLDDIMSTSGWQEVVIKPAVSANAFETIQVTAGKVGEGQTHIDRLLPTRDMMVQPFMPAVRGYGERSLMFIEGKFSHAVRRLPALHAGDDFDPWEVPLVEPTAEEMEIAVSALQAAGFPTLYARVDMVPDESNQVRLMELELVEPSLFLLKAPKAAKHMAKAIASLVTG